LIGSLYSSDPDCKQLKFKKLNFISVYRPIEDTPELASHQVIDELISIAEVLEGTGHGFIVRIIASVSTAVPLIPGNFVCRH
jgi:hypothetical protein